MQLVPVGPRAVLVEVDDPVAAASLASWARARGVPADEVVPAATTVLFDGVDPAALRASVEEWPGEPLPAAGTEVRVPVSYDGPDLAAVAGSWGCSKEEVVARHTSVALVSAFCGFAPGFAYLTGLPEEWGPVPRLASPRPRVLAGAVALADRWCAIYPTASPGGWQLIGTTEVALWDPDRHPPALLAPGTGVRFEVA